MTKYKVTNVAANNLEGNMLIHDFKVPAAVNDIHDWILDHDETHIVTDDEAYAIWLRSVLFYNYEWTYDFKKLDDSIKQNVLECNELWLADLADYKFEFTKSAAVSIDIPTEFIADLSIDDIIFANNDIEQAIFEYMLNNLHIAVQVTVR